MNKNHQSTKSKNAKTKDFKTFDDNQGITNSLMAKYMPAKLKIIKGGEEVRKGTKIA